METFLPFVWVLIPLAVIGVGAFKEWLKFKAKQDRLGTSAAVLERTVDGLRKELEESNAVGKRLVERVQNLETIVTTEMWDVVHGSSRGTEKQTELRDRKPPLELPDADDSAEDRVTRIADRLRNM